MDKSPDAFRTISEVAEVLDTPAHVLRFWESRFPQIRPVKRAGGRRYYRPADVALLFGIKHLLHDEGMTIRGVQKVLREQGVRHVAELSGQPAPEEGDNAEAALEAALAANFGLSTDAPLAQEEAETAQIVALEDALRARMADASVGQPQPDSAPDGTRAEVLPLFDAAEEAPLHAAPDLAATASARMTEAQETAPDSPGLAEASDEAASIGSQAPAPAPMATEQPPAAPPPSEPTRETAFAERPSPLPRDGRLLDRLRALPAGSLATPAARALLDRLTTLAARTAAPPQPSAN